MTKIEELNIRIGELIMESPYWSHGGNEDLAFLELGKQILKACKEKGLVFKGPPTGIVDAMFHMGFEVEEIEL